MKAIVISTYGGPEVLTGTELPDPVPAEGEILIRGRVCQLGFLGGLAPVAGFDPIADLPTGVQFSFYGSAFVLGTGEFPLGSIPLQEMVSKAETGQYQARPVRVFGFEEVVKAPPGDGRRPGRRQHGRRRELTLRQSADRHRPDSGNLRIVTT
jgi:hypothetical protein